MKKILLALLLLSYPPISFSQDTLKEVPVFQFVEDMPEFPGGFDALMEFLGKNIRYPHEAMEKGISGRVYVTFIVDTTGSVTEVKMIRGIDGLNEEAIRVVKMMPRWKAGKQSGKIVRVQYNLPIVFTLSEGKPTSQSGISKKATNAYQKGNEFMQSNNFEKAIVNYSDAIELSSNYVDAYLSRANCFKSLGFDNAACNDWRKAKALGNPDAENLILNNCGAVDSANLIQTDPEYLNGGDAGLIKFINDNLEYPELAESNNIQGTVKVRMVVDSIGNLTEAKIMRGIGGRCDEEALRVIRYIKLWKPGYVNGIAVNSVSIVPVRFKLKK